MPTKRFLGEMVKEVSIRTGISRQDVRYVIEAFIEAIRESIGAGKMVAINHFGVFSRQHRREVHRKLKAQTALTPYTPARDYPVFRAAKAWRQEVRKPLRPDGP